MTPLRIVLFCHSLVSDWNHGNAHFLRGVAWELRARGHHVAIYEPEDSWSRANLVEQLREAGYAPEDAFAWFRVAYPGLESSMYPPDGPDLGPILEDADLLIVHEWTDAALVGRIGNAVAALPAAHRPVLLFHDTHHRAVTAPAEMAAYDMRHYDGVLAFGNVLRDLYLARGWAARAWTWHEAADTRIFRPLADEPQADKGLTQDLVWVGNWGDDERAAELEEFLLDPVRRLGLRAQVYGVRYPGQALAALERAGVTYGGWLPNYRVPHVFATAALTVHIPRRPYTRALPGIPTIRIFEALACGIPLICAPWDDAEGLFKPGADYLVARDGAEMDRQLHAILRDPDLAAALRSHGLRTILARHTCAYRVDELLTIVAELRGSDPLTLAIPAHTSTVTVEAHGNAPTVIADAPTVNTPTVAVGTHRSASPRGDTPTVAAVLPEGVPATTVVAHGCAPNGTPRDVGTATIAPGGA